MFSASFTSPMYWVRPRVVPSRFCADARSVEISKTAGLATFNARWKTVKVPERSIWWPSFFAFDETWMSSSAGIENIFLAAGIEQITSQSSCRAGLQEPRTKPNLAQRNRTIASSKPGRERCIVSAKEQASLRRLTKPLRGYIRRRLARGACRPHSIPPVERVHAVACEQSAP